MKSVRALVVLSLLFVAAQASAQSKTSAQNKAPTKLPQKKGNASKVGLDANKTIRLNYGYPAWNLSKTKVDSASLLMKEGATGRLVQIQLDETATDSSIFTGLFSVQWEKISELAPEFYVPQQDLLKTNQGLKKLNTMIQNKELPRRPFILRRSINGDQFIEIFDTRDQARDAMRAYKAEKDLVENQKRRSSTEATTCLEETAASPEERQLAAKAAQERIRLEQIEIRKIHDQEASFRMQPKAEQSRRKGEAEKLFAASVVDYNASRFDDSSKKLVSAMELDPSNKNVYFQYAVTQYRLNNFNRSLVYLAAAEGGNINPIEIEFYRGTGYYGLKDYCNADASFKKVADANQGELSANAAFYIGMTLFTAKQWGPSKEAFEKTLDLTSDAKLSNRCESYIEQILAYQAFEAEKARKWTLAATLGLSYDSNILQISNTQMDSGTATDTAGWRTLQTGSVRFRPHYGIKDEFAMQLDVVNMYTVDDELKYSQTLRDTDPFVATASLPYTYKGLFLGKGFRFDLAPGYETIYMSVENHENKNIIDSYVLNTLSTLMMTEKWITNYNLELRQDNSYLTSSTGSDDATAIKLKLGFGNFIFVNQTKTKIVTADLAYSSNQAKGDNVVYDRIDASGGFIGEAPWSMMWNAKLSYYYLNYPKNAAPRTDSSYTLAAGLNRKINEIFSAGLTSSYNLNTSNIDAYDFRKFTVMSTLTAGVAF